MENASAAIVIDRDILESYNELKPDRALDLCWFLFCFTKNSATIIHHINNSSIMDMVDNCIFHITILGFWHFNCSNIELINGGINSSTLFYVLFNW